MDRAELERLDRESLVMRAQAAGIRRARVLTRPELIDELLRLEPVVDPTQLRKSRGFFGIARDLLSRVVERGLHLPDAADRFRAALGSPLPNVPRPEPQAVPTVTLAEIYAAQGHKQRAIETLRRVLEEEPEHGAARALLEKLQAADYVPPPAPLPPEPEEAADEIGAHLRAAAAEENLQSTSRPGEAESVTPQASAAVREELEALEEEAITPPPAYAGAAATFEEEPLTPRPAYDAEGAEAEEPATPGRGAARDESVATASVGALRLRTECVAIPLGGSTSYVWWRLAPEARRIADEASFFVRAVIFVPTWDGPVRETRDVACDPAAGELVLRDLPEGAIVRVAIGVMEDGELAPLAHSPALEQSPVRGLVEWTPAGARPVVFEEAAAIAHAVDGAARAASHGQAHLPGPR